MSRSDQLLAISKELDDPALGFHAAQETAPYDVHPRINGCFLEILNLMEVQLESYHAPAGDLPDGITVNDLFRLIILPCFRARQWEDATFEDLIDVQPIENILLRHQDCNPFSPLVFHVTHRQVANTLLRVLLERFGLDEILECGSSWLYITFGSVADRMLEAKTEVLEQTLVARSEELMGLSTALVSI